MKKEDLQAFKIVKGVDKNNPSTFMHRKKDK